MTDKEFQATLYRAMEDAYYLVAGAAPYRSGELKKSIKLLATDTGYEIIVLAPHMVYTEEKWISPQWRGRANPNEGWFQEVTELVFRLLRARLKGSGRYIGNKE